MDISEFLIDNVGEQAYGQPGFYFWIRTVIDAMDLLGPVTDPDLERLCRLLLDYHSGGQVGSEVIDGIRGEIKRLGFTYGKGRTPLDLKYRCIWNIANSRERNLADLYDWQYGIVTAFQNINLDGDKDQALIALIRGNASKSGMDLHDRGSMR